MHLSSTLDGAQALQDYWYDSAQFIYLASHGNTAHMAAPTDHQNEVHKQNLIGCRID